MEAYIVKIVEGKDEASIMRYDDKGFTSKTVAQQYADAKNRELEKLKEDYDRIFAETDPLITELFEEYMRGTHGKMNEENFKEDKERKRWFISNIDTLQYAISHIITDEQKKNIRIYENYKFYEDGEGLPYYYVSSTPVEIIDTNGI